MDKQEAYRKMKEQGITDKQNPFESAVNGMETGINTDTTDVAETDAAQDPAVQAAITNAQKVLSQKRQDNDIRVKVSETTEPGWFNVDMTKLAAQGRLYPADMQLIYRAARTAEIRHWSNLDDSASNIDAADHLTDLISVCVRPVSKSGTRQYSYKDIYEHDKWYLIMLIHDITFPEGSEITNPIKLKITGACKHEYEMQMTAANITYIENDSRMDKYIDSENGMFRIQTKSYGEICMKPSTIGVSDAFRPYIATLDQSQIQNARTNIFFSQWQVLDWRQLKNNKDVERVCQAYNAMDPFKELPLKLDIYEKCRILPSGVINTKCPVCGLEGTAPFRFPEGIKQIFRPISNLDSELL